MGNTMNFTQTIDQQLLDDYAKFSAGKVTQDFNGYSKILSPERLAEIAFTALFNIHVSNIAIEILRNLKNFFARSKDDSIVSEFMEAVVKADKSKFSLVLSKSIFVYNFDKKVQLAAEYGISSANFLEQITRYEVTLEELGLETPDGLSDRIVDIIKKYDYKIDDTRELLSLKPQYKSLILHFSGLPIASEIMNIPQILFKGIFSSEEIMDKIKSFKSGDEYEYKSVLKLMLTQPSIVKYPGMNHYPEEFYLYCIEEYGIGSMYFNVNIKGDIFDRDFYLNLAKRGVKFDVECLLEVFDIEKILDVFPVKVDKDLINAVGEKILIDNNFIINHPSLFNPSFLVERYLFLYMTEETWGILNKFHRTRAKYNSNFYTFDPIFSSSLFDFTGTEKYVKYLLTVTEPSPEDINFAINRLNTNQPLIWILN